MEELKRLKVQQSRQRAERDLEEKLLVAGTKELPILNTVPVSLFASAFGINYLVTETSKVCTEISN